MWRLLPPGQPAQLRAVQRAGEGRDEGGGGLPGAQGGRGAGGAVQPGECGDSHGLQVRLPTVELQHRPSGRDQTELQNYRVTPEILLFSRGLTRQHASVSASTPRPGDSASSRITRSVSHPGRNLAMRSPVDRCGTRHSVSVGVDLSLRKSA